MYSPYERLNKNRQEQAFGISLGTITGVDEVNRTCAVSTFMGTGSMDDQVVKSCQWLNPDANPDGDEFGCVPRRGAMGVVFHVCGETFVGGYLKPLSKGGSTIQGPEFPKLTAGDKIISTKAGNRITVKKSGLIEFYSKDTLQRIMFPLGSQIIDICREFNLKTDAGYIFWGNSDLESTTLYKAEFRQTLSRTFVIYEQKGYVSEDILSKTIIGPGLPGLEGTVTPSYVHTIGVDGTITTIVGPPQPEGSPTGYQSIISPDGSVEIKSGLLQTTALSLGTDGSVSIDVNKLAQATFSPEGEITCKNSLSKISLASSGDVEIASGKTTIKITAFGEVTIDAPTMCSVNAKAGIEFKCTGPAPINIESLGPVSIKGKTISIDGGTGPSDSVLCFPTTLSPFTGAPLTPFSTTVKVSK